MRAFLARLRRVDLAPGAMTTLLRLETVVAFPFFLLSWLANAIFFSVMAGFQMAKKDSAEKRKVLSQMLLGSKTKP